jgi:hypothetical protein
LNKTAGASPEWVRFLPDLFGTTPKVIGIISGCRRFFQ